MAILFRFEPEFSAILVLINPWKKRNNDGFASGLSFGLAHLFRTGTTVKKSPRARLNQIVEKARSLLMRTIASGRIPLVA